MAIPWHVYMASTYTKFKAIPYAMALDPITASDVIVTLSSLFTNPGDCYVKTIFNYSITVTSLLFFSKQWQA